MKRLTGKRSEVAASGRQRHGGESARARARESGALKFSTLASDAARNNVEVQDEAKATAGRRPFLKETGLIFPLFVFAESKRWTRTP